MQDDMEKAIALAKQGKMNPENFKKTMPDSAALLRGNLLKPNQYFDYTMVLSFAAHQAENPGAPLDQSTVSMANFYKNVLRVEKDETAFRLLFRPGTEVESDLSDPSLNGICNICIGLMCNGNPPRTLVGPKVTRNTFLKAYKDTYGYTKRSEELVKASIVDDLKQFYQKEDYSELPADAIEFLCQEVKDVDINK